MSENVILQQLDRLHEAYPEERVDIWVSWRPTEKQVRYSALVEQPDGSNSAYSVGWSETAEEAAKSLLQRAGVRDRKALREQQIEELKRKLAKLEATA